MIAWQQFDERQGEAIADGNFVCSLDDLGVILVSGDDARDYLQNQLSNDIDRIDESRLQLSSYSTPKGRMLAIFRVVQVSNGYLLLTPREMVARLLPQLYRYVVQSKVSLADASDYFARFALSTDDETLLTRDLLPREIHDVVQNDTLVSMRLEPVGAMQRFVFLCLSADEAIALWRQFADRLQVAGAASWRLSEIRAGIPSIHPATAERFVLQMSNLDALDGVSFKKGCYPGQEIVARTQYLGKLKRRMYLAELETARLPQPGDELVATGKSEVDGSGAVVDAAFDANGLCHCLYIAQIARAENHGLCLLDQPDTVIRNVELPYSL